MTKISIIVVSCGNLPLTISCLEHLLKFTYSPCQIILVDNGSAIESKIQLNNFCEKFSIDFISLNKNFGPGYGRSKGLESAQSAYIAFVDDDIIVTENWDLPLLKKLIEEDNIGQVSSIMSESSMIHPFFNKSNLREVWDSINIECNIIEKTKLFINFKSHSQFILDLIKVNSLAEYQHVSAPPDAIGGGCFMVKKSILDSIGGVADLNFQSYGNEDIDLSWRIGISGAKIYRSNYSYVHHFRHGGSEFLYSTKQRKSLLRNSNEYFITKWWEHIILNINFDDLKKWRKDKKNWFLDMILERVIERITK